MHWFHTFIDEVNQAYRAIEALRIPTVAAVRGKGVGGHLELVLHCGLVVAADTASFHAIETRTGTVPLAGGIPRLAERIGRGRTAELVLLFDPIDGTRAGKIGLATRVVADAAVDETAIALADRLAGRPDARLRRDQGIAQGMVGRWRGRRR